MTEPYALADTKEGVSIITWHTELLHIAKLESLEWLVSSNAVGHQQAFDQGLSPEEELSSLADMSEWRGCGCGGGG